MNLSTLSSIISNLFVLNIEMKNISSDFETIVAISIETIRGTRNEILWSCLLKLF